MEVMWFTRIRVGPGRNEDFRKAAIAAALDMVGSAAGAAEEKGGCNPA